jgi:hypothetical protein
MRPHVSAKVLRRDEYRKSVSRCRISVIVEGEETNMKRIIRLAIIPISAGLLLAGCATPPAATVHKAPTTAKGRLDAAFKACEAAPHKYFALCDVQIAADSARMAAWSEANSSFITPTGSRAKYLRAVANEDEAFLNMRKGLDEWLFAIIQLKSALEDYKKVAGNKNSSVVAAAMSAVASHGKEHRKNIAEFKQKVQVWQKQPRLKP